MNIKSSSFHVFKLIFMFAALFIFLSDFFLRNAGVLEQITDQYIRQIGNKQGGSLGNCDTVSSGEMRLNEAAAEQSVNLRFTLISIHPAMLIPHYVFSVTTSAHKRMRLCDNHVEDSEHQVFSFLEKSTCKKTGPDWIICLRAEDFRQQQDKLTVYNLSIRW